MNLISMYQVTNPAFSWIKSAKTCHVVVYTLPKYPWRILVFIDMIKTVSSPWSLLKKLDVLNLYIIYRGSEIRQVLLGHPVRVARAKIPKDSRIFWSDVRWRTENNDSRKALNWSIGLPTWNLCIVHILPESTARHFSPNEINTLLKEHIIETTITDWESTINLAAKKIASLRVFPVGQKLNDVTLKGCYPLRYMDQCIDSLQEARTLFYIQALITVKLKLACATVRRPLLPLITAFPACVDTFELYNALNTFHRAIGFIFFSVTR